MRYSEIDTCQLLEITCKPINHISAYLTVQNFESINMYTVMRYSQSYIFQLVMCTC